MGCKKCMVNSLMSDNRISSLGSILGMGVLSMRVANFDHTPSIEHEVASSV